MFVCSHSPSGPHFLVTTPEEKLYGKHVMPPTPVSGQVKIILKYTVVLVLQDTEPVELECKQSWQTIFHTQCHTNGHLIA